MQQDKKRFIDQTFLNHRQKLQRNFEENQTVTHQNVEERDLIGAKIVEKIKNINLIIGDLKINWDEIDDKNYWNKISSKIHFNILNNLSKNNLITAVDQEKSLIIYDYKQFYLTRFAENKNWNQTDNTFKVYADYQGYKIEVDCKLKFSNFNDHDILQYFSQKIFSDQYLDFEIDDFDMNNTLMWKEQILKKLKMNENEIVINNQKISINNNLLRVVWIDLLKIKDKEITFNLSYNRESTIIKTRTQYFLSTTELMVQFIKTIIDIFLDEKIFYFEEYHPFMMTKMHINKILFDFIKKNLTYNNLNLNIFIEDFSLKWNNDNKIVNPFLKFAEIDLYFKGFFVRKLPYFFPNNLKEIEVNALQKVIQDECVIDLSLLDYDFLDDDSQKQAINEQIYSQVADTKIKFGHFSYTFSDVYKKNNFEIVSFFLPDDTIQNNFLVVMLKMIITYPEQNILKFFSANIKIRKIETEDLPEKINNIFQDAYLKDFQKNALDCKLVYGCEDIENFSQAEIIQNNHVVLEHWKKIIGKRKFILRDYGTIETKQFIVQTAVLHHLLKDDEDLDKYASKIKQHLQNNAKKFNAIMLYLKIQLIYPQRILATTILSHLKLQFIIPLFVEENSRSERGKKLTKNLKNKNFNLKSYEILDEQETISNKASFIETSLNKMYFALFDHKNENNKNWNEIREEILEDFHEVLRKKRKLLSFDNEKYEENNYLFCGFQDNANFESENTIVFFTLENLKEQIILNFNKHKSSKIAVIENFIKTANENFITESDQISAAQSMHGAEKWKQQLYEWIGEHIVLNEEVIRVVLDRFEFDFLEKQAEKSFIAWYKYFDKHASIPVKILIKEEEQEEEKEIIEPFETADPYNSWIYNFLKAGASLGATLALLYMLIVMNCKKMFLKISFRGSSSGGGGSWNIISGEESQLLLSEYLTDNISNHLYNNVVRVSSAESIVNEQVLTKTLEKFSSLKKLAFFSSEKSSEDNDEQRIDLSSYYQKWDSKFDQAFENIKIVEHNLGFIKWGIFDTIRWGKMKISNFPDEFLFKIEPKIFNSPSQFLINKFYENISKIFDKIYVSKNDVNIENSFLIISKIIIEILNTNSPTKIFNDLYFFTSDSFWIEDLQIEEEFIRANLRHPLFFEPLIIKINFLSTYTDK